MELYRIKHNDGYVYKICNKGLHVQCTKNGKVWFSKKQAEKSLKWCKEYKYPQPRDQEYKLECYSIEIPDVPPRGEG